MMGVWNNEQTTTVTADKRILHLSAPKNNNVEKKQPGKVSTVSWTGNQWDWSCSCFPVEAAACMRVRLRHLNWRQPVFQWDETLSAPQPWPSACFHVSLLHTSVAYCTSRQPGQHVRVRSCQTGGQLAPALAYFWGLTLTLSLFHVALKHHSCSLY